MAAWTLVNSWTYSSNVAQVDFTGLGSYTDIRVLCRNITLSVSGARALRVSIDNGTSFLSTGGDYNALSTAGVETATGEIAMHATAATAARSCELEICGFDLGSPPKVAQASTRTDFRSWIIPTANALNAVRIFPSAGGNLTGGAIYLYGR